MHPVSWGTGVQSSGMLASLWIINQREETRSDYSRVKRKSSAKLGSNIDQWSFEVTDEVAEVTGPLGHGLVSVYEVLS